MKYLKSIYISAALSVLTFTQTYAQPAASEQAAPAATQTDSEKPIPYSPLEHSLTWTECKADYFKIQPSRFYYNADEGVISTIVAAAITKGVDLIGSKLRKGAEEKTHTANATLNITRNIKEGCLTFKREGYYEFVIALPMAPKKNTDLLDPQLVYYKYNKSIEGKTSGDRGVVLQIEFSNPRNDKKNSQTVNLGNLDIEKRDKIGKKLNHSIPLLQNPFFTIDEKSKKKTQAFPFVVSVTMTEVKDANEILSFLADVSDESNDAVKEILIRTVGVEQDDNNNNPVNNPVGTPVDVSDPT